MEHKKISPNICFVRHLMWIPRKCCYLRQMVDVQTLWVKLLQWDVGGVQPINLARHYNEKIKSDKRYTCLVWLFCHQQIQGNNSSNRIAVLMLLYIITRSISELHLETESVEVPVIQQLPRLCRGLVAQVLERKYHFISSFIKLKWPVPWSTRNPSTDRWTRSPSGKRIAPKHRSG